MTAVPPLLIVQVHCPIHSSPTTRRQLATRVTSGKRLKLPASQLLSPERLKRELQLGSAGFGSQSCPHRPVNLRQPTFLGHSRCLFDLIILSPKFKPCQGRFIVYPQENHKRSSLQSFFCKTRMPAIKLKRDPAQYRVSQSSNYSDGMNGRTKGEVSPRRMKWPEGPSPRNSENQDSCSISSFRIARHRACVR
jgi:hypothetical protein